MYSVIFTSTRTRHADELYAEWLEITSKLVQEIPGFISSFSHRDPTTRKGVTVAYFETEESLLAWKELPRHLEAQSLGRSDFYQEYEVFVCKVERHYSWIKKE